MESRLLHDNGPQRETQVQLASAVVRVASLVLVFALTPVTGIAQSIVDDPYHHLALTWVPGSKSAICMDTQSDSLYGAYQKTLYIGNGRGWWRAMKSWSSPVTSVGRDTFVDSHGNVYVSLNGANQLARGAFSVGGKRQWTYPVTFNCSGSNFWHMAEDAGGNLYFGEYAGCPEPCYCAFVWRSTDQGVTWACTDTIASRHVHGIWTDATRDTLYMSVGDGPPAPEQSLLYRSVNAGEDWDLLYDEDLYGQPVSSVGTASGYQVWGGDFGPQSAVNCIYRSHGADTAFQTTYLPGTAAEDAYMWTMSKNGRGVIFCGTATKRKDMTQVSILRSGDDGATWTRVLNLGTGSNIFTGVLSMTTRFGADRCGYFFDNTGATANLWKFRDASFTVGNGGDYATIAGALLETGPGDTLILLAGTHDADACNLHNKMTIRGETPRMELYRIRNADPNHAAIVVDSTAIVRNVTFCGLDDGLGGREEPGPPPSNTGCDAVICSASNSIVSRCAFYCGTGYAVRGAGVALTLTDNMFVGSGQAVAVVDGASYITGNTFPGLGKAVELTGGTFRGGGTIRALEPGASYHVLGDLRVGDSGTARTLTIEPGTTVRFASGTGIQVGYVLTRGYYGKLSAIGTATKPIVIEPLSGQQGDWKGIYFPYGLGKGGTLRHCVISAGGQTWDGQSANVIDMCDFNSPVLVDSCTVRLSSGCGIYSRWGAARITHSTISENAGDGVFCKAGSLTVDGSIITGSTSGYGVRGETATGLLTCCDVWDNAGGGYGGSMGDQTGQNGNISEDPLFCAPREGDYRLHASSPCIDAPGCGRIGSYGEGCGDCGVAEPWALLATALPDSIRDHAGVVHGDFAYVSGGLVSGGACTDRTIVAALSGGTCGPWAATAALPDSVRDHCVVSAGEWIYSMGGGEGAVGTAENPMFRTVHDDVWRAAPTGGGALSSWEACAPLPTPIWGAGAAVWNGRIYLAGGSPSDSLLGVPSDRIRSAPVAPDGNVGPWIEDPVRLPEAVTALQLLAYDGRLWAIGGQAGSPSHQARAGVASTAILQDGTLDPGWVAAQPLPGERHSFGAALDSDGTLYVVGGVDAYGSSRRSVYWASLLPGGATTVWNVCNESIPPLPDLGAAVGVSHMPCMYHAHQLYVVGGYGWAGAADHGFRTEVLAADLIPSSAPTGVPGDDVETGEPPVSPSRFAICAVRPNPLSSSARITYTVPTPGCAVSLRIYDVRGRRVRTLVETVRQDGIHAAVWDGRTDGGTLAASGVYFCRLTSGALCDTRKLALLR